MNINEMKANGHRLINEFINNAKMDVADELFSPNFVNHSPEQGVTADLGGLKQYISRDCRKRYQLKVVFL